MEGLALSGLDVALLTPAYWPEVRRGTERFVHELARGLSERGHRPRIVAGAHRAAGRAMEDGVPVLRIPRVLDGSLRRLGFEDYLAHVPLTYGAVRLDQPDVAHAMFAGEGAAAARFTRVTGRPSVFSYMGIPERPWLLSRRLRHRLTARAARGCSAVVALSRAAAAEFDAVLGVEARVIPPGVDLGAFTPGGARAEAPTVLCASAIAEPAKRVPDLLQAFATVREDLPDARLLLSRPRRAAEADVVAGRQPGVTLLDLDDRAVLCDTYRAAWVSALPSHREAFGLVALESLACGTPVVGRRTGGIPDILDSEAVGTLFDGGPEAIANALRGALDAPPSQATVAVCRKRAEGFSTDRCTEAYLDLYTELLGAV